MSAVLLDENARRKRLRRHFFLIFFAIALGGAAHELPRIRDERLARIKPCPPLQLQTIDPMQSFWARSEKSLKNSLREFHEANFGCQHEVAAQTRAARREVPLGFLGTALGSLLLWFPANLTAKATLRCQVRLLEGRQARSEARDRRRYDQEDERSRAAAAAQHERDYRMARREYIIKIMRLAINDFESGAVPSSAVTPELHQQVAHRRAAARTSLTGLVAKYSDEQLIEVMRHDRTAQETLIDLESCLHRLGLGSDAAVRSLRRAVGTPSMLKEVVA
jgi:hypothetical protein